MSGESPTETQKQPIRTCKFYGSNLRGPRVYPSPSRRSTILIDLSESQPLDHSSRSAKHGAARWTLDGLGSKRLRLHGKVEGNLSRLRMDKDDDDYVAIPPGKENDKVAHCSSKSKSNLVQQVVRPPPPPVGTKRSRYASLIDEEED